MSDVPLDFIRSRIRSDVEKGIVKDQVVTRFPPEPNGYLHIGHAKAICLNFGVAEEFGGITYLRFDDTNPLKESDEFVDSIQFDINWLGFDWDDRLTFASDYFEQLYGFAEQLIDRDKAFVCDLSADDIRETRGTLYQAGKNSPYRDRSIAENRALFHRMRAGDFENGARTLRAKIDMSSPNVNMRDPVLYRILHASHQRTGESWCIYPMYDFTHCICDALEGITHSLCSLEFEDHRPLYDWVLENININFHPPQIEFSRLNLENNLMSKRILGSLIERGFVSGWNDPRLPTISGLRRRGVPGEAIREFCARTGVTKQAHIVETSLLDFCTRQSLEDTTPRGFAVLDPLPMTVVNFEGEDERLSARYHPKHEALGNRDIWFGRELVIERTDFIEEATPKLRKLAPLGLARLRYGYIVRCVDVERDQDGNPSRLLVEYVPESKSGQDSSGLKPKAVIHWLSTKNTVDAEFRLFENLFSVREPGTGAVEEELNPDSLVVKSGLIEKSIIEAGFERIQFERTGYFAVDSDSSSDNPVFNRIAPLVDGFKKK